ncbi:MAG TPA: hypothetical protein VGO52_01780 [Hyphomonadaceae bacterium]|nr:hypothetical protein [Hyphomonadaceae bacterium]
MTDEILNSGPGPAEQRMRVFISFAEGEEEFADYLGYVLALRGFEPSSSPAPRFRRRIIGKTEASIFVLTAAAAASKRVIGELAETVNQSKPALILVPGALTDVAIPAEFSAHPFIQSWRNPDAPGSSLVNGLLALEQALDAARLVRSAPVLEIPEQAVTETAERVAAPEPAIAAEPAAEPELAAQEAEPASQARATEPLSVEALTSAFAESVPDPFAITELPAAFAEPSITLEAVPPAVTPETIAAELMAEPPFASAPTLESSIPESLAALAAEPPNGPMAEFIFDTLEPQLDTDLDLNPHLSPVFQVKLEPTYDVLDLTIRAEEAPLLKARIAQPLPPLAFPRLVSSQPASRVQPPRTTPALINKGQGGNARRRSVAHLAIVTASLMCAAANAPWLISFISAARSAAAEERARLPSAPSLKPSVTIRNSEADGAETPEAAIAPASPEPDVTTLEPEAIESAAPAATPAAVPAAPAPAPTEAAAAPVLTDAELAQQLDHDDWLEARKIGNLAAFRAYIEKHADGVHYAEAMDRARRRIAELSTKPVSTLVYLTGPAFFRGLPTRDVDGVEAGAKGQDVYIIDRIATRREGDWLVFERGGAWPFLFVNAPEVQKAE